MEQKRSLQENYKDTKVTVHAKMDTIKERNGMDITEEDIKKRWQEYTKELYRKYLNDPDRHNSVITHLELNILECEVKWALGSITMSKTSEGDGIPAELLQILMMMLLKYCIQEICRKFEKLSSCHRTGKGQFSQSQTKAMPKNVQTTTRLQSFHMLARQCSKTFELGFNNM